MDRRRSRQCSKTGFGIVTRVNERAKKYSCHEPHALVRVICEPGAIQVWNHATLALENVALALTNCPIHRI